MWENIVELGGPQMTMYYGARALHAWIHKTTNTHSEYVILVAFLWQQWLRECAEMLRNTCVACIV